ncbi:hypothetical protein ABW21_db0208359 [Orbilia brochopaga]|nr:hypothetical protein ABW21_db0208359 [Drechslerella brochopaga]
MKISFSTILAATSSLLATGVVGKPVTSNKTLKLMACSGELEGTLATVRWPPIITDEVLQQQKEYLRENSYRLPDCKPFEYATMEECIILGKEAAAVSSTFDLAQAASRLQPRSPEPTSPTSNTGDTGNNGNAGNNANAGKNGLSFSNAIGNYANYGAYNTPKSGLDTIRSGFAMNYLSPSSNYGGRSPKRKMTETPNTLRMSLGKKIIEGSLPGQIRASPGVDILVDTEPDELLYPDYQPNRSREQNTGNSNSYYTQKPGTTINDVNPSKISWLSKELDKGVSLDILLRAMGIQKPQIDVKKILADITPVPRRSVRLSGAPTNVIPVVQDQTSKEYIAGFVITPGGFSEPTKLNAVYDPFVKGNVIIAYQYEHINPTPSKWVIKNKVLFLAGTEYFAYVCAQSGQKSGFMLGKWSNLKELSERCPGLTQFYYSGWQFVQSTAKAGYPAAKAEIQFNNPKLLAPKKDNTNLNSQGLFAAFFPLKGWEVVWDVRRKADGTVYSRLPTYAQLTTLPKSVMQATADTENDEDKPFWLYYGDVERTGNPVKEGWTLNDIEGGKPIQLQASIPEKYPQAWYLTQVKPKTDPFGAYRSENGEDVVMGSLDWHAKPGVWYYNKSNKRLYKWGTAKFMYTCRDADSGGAFLRNGNVEQATDDCGDVNFIHPIQPVFTTSERDPSKVDVQLGNGLISVSPDASYTIPGYAYSETGAQLVSRLLTLGKPNYKGLTIRERSEAETLREINTVIIEAFVVDLPSDQPYVLYPH